MQLERLDIAGRQVCLADHRPAIPGSHPPLLLVHGAGHDHGVWDEVGARLAGAGLHAIAPDLPGHLVVVGHHHPVVSLVDSVGCAARARPAYLYSTVEEPSGERTRLLFVPAFNEFAGGIDVGRLRESGLGPLSRCIDEKNAEVFLADGTYVGSPATLCPADDR